MFTHEFRKPQRLRLDKRIQRLEDLTEMQLATCMAHVIPGCTEHALMSTGGELYQVPRHLLFRKEVFYLMFICLAVSGSGIDSQSLARLPGSTTRHEESSIGG